MTNAIKNTVSTIITSAQGAKVKTVSAQSSLTNPEVLTLAGESAKAYMGFVSASESLNAVIEKAHKAGLRLVDTRNTKANSAKAIEQTKLFKSAFIDTVKGAGKSDKTAQNYYELVAKGINTGKGITSTNPSMGKAKGKGKDKNPPAFLDVLAKVYNHADFETLSDIAQGEIEELLSEGGYITEEN